MRRLAVLLAFMLAALVGIAGVAPSASAATGVTINRISAPEVSPGAKVRIRPNVSTAGPVKVTKKYLSVYRAGSDKRIVKNRKSAKLGAGTYKVKTTVKYKTKKRTGGYTATRSATRWQRLVITTSTATCATTADAARVRTGDGKATVAATLHSQGRLDWTTTTDGIQHEHWRYTLCGSQVQWVWVTFENGRVTDAWVE